MLRFFTAGESHGPCLTAIIDGMIAGVPLDEVAINQELLRRQQGYGRGARMKLETDMVQLTAGVRFGQTIGSPLALVVANKDDSIDRMPAIANPRPGHADLAGALKYDRTDIRDILERASARETAIRVAVGAVAKSLLAQFNIQVASHIVSIGRVFLEREASFEEVLACDQSLVRCVDEATSERMMAEIDEAKKQGSSAGGVFEVVVRGVPVGLGSHVQWDRKLDARLSYALMSMQAIKGVEVGQGFSAAACFGHELHDEIAHDTARGFYRKSNRAGGIEGGTSNGQDIVVRAAMKPLSTLIRALDTVDIHSKEVTKASVQRTDTCAVPAAGVIGEAIVAFEIAAAFLDKFGGDSLSEVKRNYESYLAHIQQRMS